MNRLNIKDRLLLANLSDKIQIHQASTNEMKQFLDIIKSTGENNYFQLQKYLQVAGYSSVEEFEHHFKDRQSKEFWEGLAKIGGAVLIGYELYQLLKKK